jgi:hypothetical protein
MSDDPSDKSRPRTTKHLSAKESSDLFMARAMENLRKAGEEARRKEELENRYQPLSKEEWGAVADDLKEHLRLTEKQRRYEKLVTGMMESVPKYPMVH